MGISFKKREDDMKILSIPLLLPSLLAAEVLQRTLEIQEHGTSYTQTVTFDFDRKVQIIDVPAHNNIVQSRTIFDFNQGMMVEAQPGVKHCYLKEIPKNMASMDQMIKGLSKRGKAPVNAATAPVSEKRFGKFQEIKVDVLANDEMMKECENYKIFRVSEWILLCQRGLLKYQECQLMDGWMVTAVQVTATFMTSACGRPANMEMILVIGLSIAQWVMVAVRMLSTTATSMTMIHKFPVPSASQPIVEVLVTTARQNGIMAAVIQFWAYPTKSKCAQIILL